MCKDNAKKIFNMDWQYDKPLVANFITERRYGSEVYAVRLSKLPYQNG